MCTWHQWICSEHTCDLAHEPAQEPWDGSWACWGFYTRCWAKSWAGSGFSFNSELWAEPAQLSSNGELSWLRYLAQFWAMHWMAHPSLRDELSWLMHCCRFCRKLTHFSKMGHFTKKSTISQNYNSYGKSENSNRRPVHSSNNGVLLFEVNL